MYRKHKKILLLLLLWDVKAYSVSFNTNLLAGNSKNTDISHFYNEGNIPQGIQTLDIYVNDQWKCRCDLIFDDKKNISIKLEDAKKLGIKFKNEKNKVILLSSLVHDGSISVRIKTLSLYLTIPQKYILDLPAGYPP
ncbi:hypothetical protein HH682_10785, partial [Rosenbergiella sp. S61]